MSFEEIRERKVRARNVYLCSWCPERIEKGELHYYRAFRMEGEFQTDRMHVECFAAMEASDYSSIADGWLPGEHARGVCA